MERIMSVVNLGLQSVGLMRKEMNSDAEKALKNCNSLKQIRSAGEKYKTEIAESLQQPIDLVSDIMRRLELKKESTSKLNQHVLNMNWKHFGKYCFMLTQLFLRMTLVGIKRKTKTGFNPS